MMDRAECAVIWVNELRLSEFDEKGGWAAVARMNAQHWPISQP
jgi:cell surface protein SprA